LNYKGLNTRKEGGEPSKLYNKNIINMNVLGNVVRLAGLEPAKAKFLKLVAVPFCISHRRIFLS